LITAAIQEKLQQNIPEEIGLTYHIFGVRNQYILEMCKGHPKPKDQVPEKTRFN